MTLLFDMPPGLTANEFLAELKNEVDVRPILQQKTVLTFYDSFDWRLYSNGIVSEFIQSNSASLFTLMSIENNSLIASTELSEPPVFSHHFKPGKIRNVLEPILEMRALLPICKVDYISHRLNIVNKDEKIVLRICIDEYQELNNRVSLHPIKGYEKSAGQAVELLTARLRLTKAFRPVLEEALKLNYRRPQDYSSKLNFKLQPDTRADTAAKFIFSSLLKTIKANEQGVLADTDSEFLHDFRVAVRRTRTGLSQLKGVFPKEIHAYFGEFFSWLGQITGATRDIDVYLLNFERYKNSLPILIREDLNPLQEFLFDKKQRVHQEMAIKLRSSNYRSKMAEWEIFLSSSSHQSSLQYDTHRSIKELANLRLWKNYKRVLHKGCAITSSTNAETFHELRKTCKKMRYLIEFFESLYQDGHITILVKKLKDLQEVLGDYQDYEVQEHNLKQFSNEMLAQNIPVNTFLAMGVLIQTLDTNKCRARKQFESRFEAYKLTQKHLAIRELFQNHEVERIQY